MSDKYDEAIAYLTKHPDAIQDAWQAGDVHEEAGCLFVAVAPEHQLYGHSVPFTSGGDCGCLTTIRCGDSRFALAWTKELTEAIRADERIPKDPDDITVEHLPIFAEWQRRIDKELNRA